MKHGGCPSFETKRGIGPQQKNWPAGRGSERAEREARPRLGLLSKGAGAGLARSYRSLQTRAALIERKVGRKLVA